MWAPLRRYLDDREEAREALYKILDALENQELEPEFRAELERHAVTITKALDYTWHPNTLFGWICVVAILLLPLQQATAGNYEPFIYWLALPFFIPRFRQDVPYQWHRLRRWLASLRGAKD